MSKYQTLILLCLFTISMAQSQSNASYVVVDTISQQQDTLDFSLIIYSPENCRAHFTVQPPDSTDSTKALAVAAAFTAQNLKNVVGDYVQDGILQHNKTDVENGYCLLYSDTIVIGYLSDSSEAKNKAIQQQGCYFQQMLLLKNSDTVECTIFRRQKPTFRRCLAILNGRGVVIESLSRLTFEDFAKAVQRIGVRDAIYLDMGTWSEGFIRNKDLTITQIGHLKANTKHQTNWIEFVSSTPATPNRTSTIKTPKSTTPNRKLTTPKRKFK